MKFLLIGVFVASLALSGVLALPARLPSDDAEVISVPRRSGVASRAGAGVGASVDSDDIDPDFKDFGGFIDTGVGYPFLAQPNLHPFLGFFDSFEDIFRRLHTRLWPVVLTNPAAADGGADSSNEAGLFGFNLNPQNGNTTSTVKIVDGHKIEVNETVYGDANNVFKVRVVNIRPVDSDEDTGVGLRGGDGDTASDSDVNTVNPVTSAPSNRNGVAAEDDDDDLDERREPLSKKQPTENEIRGNIDDPEHSKHPDQQQQQQQYETMLPPTTNEDNAANLNAAFVTDNSLEEAVAAEEENQSGNGNIEAETNKPVTDNEDREAMRNYDEAALAAKEQQPNEQAADSSLVENERLTIENNEEPEEIDNFNESSQEQVEEDEEDKEEEEAVEEDSTAVSEQAGELQQQGELAEELNVQQELTKELSELALSAVEDSHEAVKENVEAIAEFNSESENDNDDHDDDEDDEAAQAAVNSSASHANYAPVNKHREDVSSSDDEAEGDAEMNEEFNSEWENLAEDLAAVNDKNNDLSNDIDVYDVEPVDLSNDIAVNDLAAAQADFPLNPDAEFLSVADDGAITSPHSSMPKFEKLSVAGGATMDPTTSYQHQLASFSQNMK